MTKLLVVTSTFPGKAGDGTPQFVLDLTSRIADLERVVVVTPRVPGAARFEVIEGIEVRRFAYFVRPIEGVAHGATLPNVRAQPWRVIELPFLFVAMLVATIRAARSVGPDVIHAHWLLPSGAIAAAVPSRWRAPIVVTAHGVDLHSLKVAPVEMVRRWALRRAAHVLAVSGDLRQRVQDLAPSVSVEVLPMGTDLAEVAAAVGPRAPEPDKILFVGRLADKKGVDVAIKAMRSLPRARLVVAGDGPEGPSLERLANDIGVADRVEFVGRVSRAQVFEQLGTCAVLVMPSVVGRDGDMEGTPVVLAEALAAGVPVVASRLGGIAEVLAAGGGWLVEPGDADALAGALGAALGDPDELSQRGRFGRDHVAPSLDMANIAQRYRQIYSEVSG